jgi:hypothetical protein
VAGKEGASLSDFYWSSSDRWAKHPEREVMYLFWRNGPLQLGRGDRNHCFTSGRTLAEAYREAARILGAKPERFKVTGTHIPIKEVPA